MRFRRALEPILGAAHHAQSFLSRLVPFGVQILLSSLSYGAGIQFIQVDSLLSLACTMAG